MGRNRSDFDLIFRTSNITLTFDHLGDNYASVLYYELQYNTTYTPNEWVSVPIEQRKEIFNEVKSPDGSVKLEPKITSKECFPH